MEDITVPALWSVLVISIALTIRALAGRSWVVMWVAALGSLVVSFLGMLSIGGLTILLTSLQIAAAVGLRQSASTRRWAVYVPLAVLVWVIVVPVQLFATQWLSWFFLFPLLGALGLVLPLLPISKSSSLQT